MKWLKDGTLKSMLKAKAVAQTGQPLSVSLQTKEVNIPEVKTSMLMSQSYVHI